MTVNLWLQQPMSRDEIKARYAARYANEALVEVIDEAPWVSHIANQHGVQVGAFTTAPGNKRVVIVSTLAPPWVCRSERNATVSRCAASVI